MTVIVTLPNELAPGLQIAVNQRDWGVEVDVRQDTRAAWVPLAHIGGRFEVRP